jgi:hypothetical protein
VAESQELVMQFQENERLIVESERRISDKRANIAELRTETSDELEKILANFDECVASRTKVCSRHCCMLL